MIEVAILGAINWDINLFIKRFPEIGEEVPVEKITRVPGGKAANASVAAARILGPGRVSVIGCLGKDLIGETQVKILEEEGVVTLGIMLLEGEESGQAYIIIDENGRNMINTFFGANMRLLPTYLQDQKILNLMHETSIVTVIDPPIETIQEAVFIGKEELKTVVWDAGVRSTLGVDRLREVLRNVDYLVINEIEVKNLTRARDPLMAWEVLSKIRDDIKLVAKLGSRGCMMIGPSEAVKVRAVNLKRLGLRVANTVGCGDAFLGAFIASKAEGLSDEEALERANLAGALKATKPETRGSPSKAELEKYSKFMEHSQPIKRFRDAG